MAETSAPHLPVAPSPVAAETRTRQRWTGAVVAGLLVLYGVLAFTASLGKGMSFDEGMHLAIGYNLWLRDDYRIEGGNGDLIKRWAALPLVFTHPRFVPTTDPDWQKAEPYDVARKFFFDLGNDEAALLAQGRAMVVLLGVIGGWLVYACAREIFGEKGGLVALIAYVFSPHMLAFAGTVSTDLSITVTLFGSTWCIWRLLHGISWLRVLASLLIFGLLLLAKPTALVILPVTVVMIAVKLLGGRPLVVKWRGAFRATKSRWRQLAIYSVLVVAHGLFGWTAIWAHYGFRYLASPDPANPALVFRAQPVRDGTSAAVSAVIAWSRQTHFFPEGFRRGVNRLLGSDDRLGAFMNGHWKAGGWTMFFPYTIWAKTPPGLFLLLGLAAAAWWRAGRPGAVLYAVAPFMSLVAVYLAVAMSENINLGHRHVLPVYPALYVMCGVVALLWAERAMWLRGLAALGLAWIAYDSFRIRPDYLAYFGAQVGGADRGYTHLVDSSLDWGMDLPGLKRWLDRKDPKHTEKFYLAYFGTDRPEYYGIESHRLPGFFEWRHLQPFPLEPGLYAISATLFQSVYVDAFGPWNKTYESTYWRARQNMALWDSTLNDPEKRAELLRSTAPGFWDAQYAHYDQLRFARLCAWLRHQGPPPQQIGHSIFVWRLDEAAIYAALVGPPVELEEKPVVPVGEG